MVTLKTDQNQLTGSIHFRSFNKTVLIVPEVKIPKQEQVRVQSIILQYFSFIIIGINFRSPCYPFSHPKIFTAFYSSFYSSQTFLSQQKFRYWWTASTSSRFSSPTELHSIHHSLFRFISWKAGQVKAIITRITIKFLVSAKA